MNVKPAAPIVHQREPGDESEPNGESSIGVDDLGRKVKKPRSAKPVPRDELKDQLGNVVPDNLRDIFGDPSLAGLVEDLENVLAFFRFEPWVTLAGKLTAHYPFILIEAFAKHVHASLEGLQLAIEAVKAGLPHAVCPKCGGVKVEGKVCRTCRGGGAVPEHKLQEASE